MFVQSTISCGCGCIFEAEFQGSSHDNPPVCPQCNSVMDNESWKRLRSIMSEFNDFSTDMIRWHSDRGEPLMQVPVITIRALKGD
jgi:hypothetical protein